MDDIFSNLPPGDRARILSELNMSAQEYHTLVQYWADCDVLSRHIILLRSRYELLKQNRLYAVLGVSALAAIIAYGFFQAPLLALLMLMAGVVIGLIVAWR